MPKNRETKESLFARLSKLFRDGPNIRRKIKTHDTAVAEPDKVKSSGALIFQKSSASNYSTITANAYNLTERLMRYTDFNEMELTAELSSALDLYADETTAADDKGRVLHIFSDDKKIKTILENLYYGTLNIEFNARPWARNLVKFGDHFNYIDVSPEYGVINTFPIPINEIEREENYDPEDPFSYRFRWVTLGNRTLESWEVAHMRLLGNDMFLPYGSSVLEPARRIWRQLILIEDAMLVYRIVRAPDRRVFYIDVGNIPPDAVDTYVQQVKATLRTQPVTSRTDGRVDLRFNPMSIDEDFIIPVRGGESGTKIENLAGGQNTAAVEDVQYIQKKMIASLKIPRAYLGYEEALSSKSSLAQMDVRFSRTINVIQRTMISELNKIAIIHLYAHGYRGDDLTNYTLRFSNPSTVAQQQKLELVRAKFDIASSIPENIVDRRFVQTEVMGLTVDEIKAIDEGLLADAAFASKLESAGAEAASGGGGSSGGGGGGLLGDLGGDEDLGSEEDTGESPEEGGDEPPEDLEAGASDDDNGSDELLLSSDDPTDKPVKTSNHSKMSYNRSRRNTNRQDGILGPDYKRSFSDSSEDDPNDTNYLRAFAKLSTESRDVEYSDRQILSPDIESILRRMSKKFGFSEVKGKSKMLVTESVDVQETVDKIRDNFIEVPHINDTDDNDS
jgi:hypothetical protein